MKFCRSKAMLQPHLSQFFWDVSSLTAFLVGAFSAIWLPDRWEPRCFFGLVLVAMSISAWKHRAAATQIASPGPIDIEGGLRRLRSSALFAWMVLSGFTLGAVVVLYFICRWAGAFHGNEFVSLFDKSAGSWLQTKLPTVVGQQIMLQLLLLPVLIRLCRRVSVAVFCGATIFAMLHLPNPVLVVMTFLAGIVWIACYSQARRLTPVVLSHCVLAMMAAGFCGEYILNMRVGPKCAELFPRRLDTEAGTLYEFPGCTVGVAERLVQRRGDLFLEGWAYDSIHHCSPTGLYLSVNRNFTKIEQFEFVRSPASRWKDASLSGFVDDTCYSFTATIPVSVVRSVVNASFDPATDVGCVTQEVRLFAANVNGRLTEIPCQGEIRSIPDLQTEQTVVLFPVEIDGRINLMGQQQGDVQLKGWTADLQSHAIPKRMYVEFDGTAREINIQSHRSPRPDVARALQDPNLAQCGFDVPIGQGEAFSVSQIRCFAVDDQQQLHPLPLTEQARTRVAEQSSSDFK